MIFVTGSSGQLGYEVCKALKCLNMKYYPITRKDFDLLKFDDILKFFDDKKVDIIIHCAAYTDVNKAERDREICNIVNYESTKILLNVCKMLNCKFVYISTDYVFDGKKTLPYEVDDIVNPINYYGFTKAKSENYIVENYSNSYIIRVSSLYGINGRNFVKSILNYVKSNSEISLVYDQIISPSYANNVAYGIINVMNFGKCGIYHLTNDGYCTVYDFMSNVFSKINIEVKVKKISLLDYDSCVKRGLNMMLSNKCLIKNNVPILEDIYIAIDEFLKEMGYTIEL